MQTKKQATPKLPRILKSPVKTAQSPQKPSQAHLNLRVSPTLKSQLSALAKQRGVSLSRFVALVLEERVKQMHQPTYFMLPKEDVKHPSSASVQREVNGWWAKVKSWLA